MGATSYRYLVNDISKSFNLNFPDSNITSPQILYWCRVAENFIRQRTLKVMMTGSYLTEFQSVSIQTDGVRKWIVLPSQIVDLDNEKGVDYIMYQQDIPFGKQIRFVQTDVNVIDRLYYNPYETPSPSNPYFYRVGQNIYVLGIENVGITQVQMGLYTSLDTRPSLIPIDSLIGIDEEQIPSLKELVFQYAKLSLIVPKDRVEEGTDDRNENIKTFSKATQAQQTE